MTNAQKDVANKSSAETRSGEQKKTGKSTQRAKAMPKNAQTKEKRHPIVGVGASAGGLTAFRELLKAMPTDTGMGFVLIQHLDPKHESLMTNILGKATSMPVLEVENDMEVKPDHVYMIPPNYHLDIQGYNFKLTEFEDGRLPRLSIDHFFASLALTHFERAIAIVLSGTGSDGSQGIREVKAAGGLTIAQEPKNAEFAGMPIAAIATGQIDQVLNVEQIPNALLDYARHPYIKNGEAEMDERPSVRQPETFRSIINVLRMRTEVDFRCYKSGTLERRIERRMSLRRMDDLETYLNALRTEEKEVELLFRDLLINVTRFFRDPPAWVLLEKKVVTPLVEGCDDQDDSFRVWVPGCATGEEAYSIAMLLFEVMDKQKNSRDIQVFGTDLDERSIAIARSGIYPGSIADDVGPSRLRRFFTEEGDGFRVSKRLRDAVIFAAQNIVGDPPFSKLDLISCRNLLIYLDNTVQPRLIDLFQFALQDEGYLFLGNSESVGHSKGFVTIDKAWRIYQKRAESDLPATKVPVLAVPERTKSLPDETSARPHGNVAKRLEAQLLADHTPAAVVIDLGYEVLHMHGALSRYLVLPAGKPSNNLLRMVPDETLRRKLRMLVRQTGTDGHTTAEALVRYERLGEWLTVQLKAQRLAYEPNREHLCIVTFGTAKLQIADQLPSGEDATPAIEDLQLQLHATREDLQNSIQDMESTNEELKASNEEVMSMNEELQSANEELETSREELQSLNEELSTVNSQLSEKVGELEAANNDLTNLLVSTDIATIFLDNNLRIRRFTPAATTLLRVIATDIGRPIDDLAPRVDDPNLCEDAQKVLDSLTPIECEVAKDENFWYLRRIVPYRTTDHRIQGVVVTFSDVTRLKHTSKRLDQQQDRQTAILELSRMALSQPSLDEFLSDAAGLLTKAGSVDLVEVLEITSKTSFRLTAGYGWRDGVVGSATVPAGKKSQAGFTVSSGSPVIVKNGANEKRFSIAQVATEHNVVCGLTVAIGPEDSPWGVLGIHATSIREFIDEDVVWLEAIANILWSAILNCQAKQ